MSQDADAHVPSYLKTLRTLYEAAGNPTLDSVAHRAPCARATVSTTLSGQNVPSHDIAGRIARALDGEPDDEFFASLTEERERRRNPPPPPPASNTRRWKTLAIFAAGIGLVVAVVLLAVVIDRSSDRGPAPAPPPATTLYILFRSTNPNDARAGAPTVVRPAGLPPDNEYEQIDELGTGPAVDPDSVSPGTLKVYDHFCTGSGKVEPCGGVFRSHYFTLDATPVSPWPAPLRTLGVRARFYAPGADGSCGNGRVAIHRYERRERGLIFFAVDRRSPGPEWVPAELLGCLVR